jgi:arylsulfatase A-like enzyme
MFEFHNNWLYMRTFLPRRFNFLLHLVFALAPWSFVHSQGETKPNIVIILTDDQGFADISYNSLHPPEVSTPNMDALARESIFFTQAYISGNVCSPTRAGLMLGKYQQRVGVYTAGEGGSGFSLDEKIFPGYLQEAGYVSGAFGKWHLGLTLPYNPVRRGFDEFYGFMGRGAHDYYRLSDPEEPMYRNNQVISDSGYLTTRLTEEAVDFIKRHKIKPFFLYLAYNAVHFPKQAPAEDIKKFDTGDPDRDILMAMLMHLDAGVGNVVKTLKEEGVWENTLLFFLTDNGGAKTMHAVNTPLRGFKQENYEGGIRTPFVISWPARYRGGREIHTPVISLDILPTVLDAAGIELPEDVLFDGKSILPLLDGKYDVLHQNLFWSEGGGTGEWAVRSGDWKLVVHKDKFELFNLGNDISESTDLADQHPEVVKKLTVLYDKWLDEMAEPLKEPGKRWFPEQ